jgi:hypothetical protein
MALNVADSEKQNKPAARSGVRAMPLRPPRHIQESLKILRFRFRRNVGFRPVMGRGGARFYRINGKLRAESEILLWTESTRTRPS